MGNEGVIAVEKALALLDCFRPGNDSLTLTELAQLSGYHKTTVYRLMNSLERMNYIIRHDDGTYTLGHRLLYLGKLYEQSFELARVVQPELQALSQASSESASWYVIEGGQRLCLFRAEASQGLRHSNLPGSQFPLDGSAISKVLRHWGLGAQARRQQAILRKVLRSERVRLAKKAGKIPPLLINGSSVFPAWQSASNAVPWPAPQCRLPDTRRPAAASPAYGFLSVR